MASFASSFLKKRDFFYSLNVSGTPEGADVKYTQQSQRAAAL
jgi:hypothetical protein